MAGIQVTTEDGRLIGPFNSYLPHQEVATGLSEFKAAEATHTTLSERVREVVIIAVGAAWGADFELYAHTAAARKAGLYDHAVTTLANGGIPEDLGEQEKIAARVAHQLSTRHRVDDELYREAEQAFGRRVCSTSLPSWAATTRCARCSPCSRYPYRTRCLRTHRNSNPSQQRER